MFSFFVEFKKVFSLPTDFCTVHLGRLQSTKYSRVRFHDFINFSKTKTDSIQHRILSAMVDFFLYYTVYTFIQYMFLTSFKCYMFFYLSQCEGFWFDEKFWALFLDEILRFVTVRNQKYDIWVSPSDTRSF